MCTSSTDVFNNWAHPFTSILKCANTDVSSDTARMPYTTKSLCSPRMRFKISLEMLQIVTKRSQFAFENAVANGFLLHLLIDKEHFLIAAFSLTVDVHKVRRCHYANMSVQYTAIFHGCKNDNFQMKNFDIFLIFAQNIDCGYSLEPPQRGGSNEYRQSMFWSKNKKNMYTRVNPTFSI